MRAITEWLRRRGWDSVADDQYSNVKLWESWYKGYVPSFHNYRQYNGKRPISRCRKTMNMAKTVCEDWANILLNEKVSIVAGDEAYTDMVWAVLDANGFRWRGNQLVELAFALGTAAIVERMDGEDIKLDYIRAGMIYPLTWDNKVISECAFASERRQGKKAMVYVNIHRKGDDGNYIVENHLLQREGAQLRELDLPEGVEAEVHTGSAVPRFQIITPNVVNNADLDSPMGVSVFGNAIDQLEACDLVFDSYCNEFRLGKKRIMVPLSFARIDMEEDGTTRPVFDDSDTEFYAIPELDGDGNRITEFNMELRYQAHEAALQTALNMLSAKCGMGNDRYSFQNGGPKTATEIISERSDLYQSMRKHELLLEGALVGMVRAICDMSGIDPELEVAINFDDSIIEDSSAERATDRQDIQDGLLSPYEYRMKWRGEDEVTAKARMAELTEAAPALGFEI